jgi:16S rRNA (guanine966-N2)-methyltransferase
MRVIAGRFKGQTLHAPRGSKTRPTSEKVREALFSMLGEIDGLQALDLFAGSGALGIEALSRGAERVVFADRDHAAVTVLQRNLSSLRLDEGEAEIRRTDAAQAMRAARERHETYDLIFIDPPYSQARDWSVELSGALEPLLRAAGRVIVESDRRNPLQLELPLERERRYGDTLIKIHRNQ